MELYLYSPTCIHGMARASAHLPIATFLFEMSVLVSFGHIYSITKVLRRPFESLSCKSSEMWQCPWEDSKPSSGNSSPRTQRLIHPSDPWGTAVLPWQHHIPEGSELKCQSSVWKRVVMKWYVGEGCCYGIVDCVTVKWKPEYVFIYLFIPWILTRSKKLLLQNPSILCLCACW